MKILFILGVIICVVKAVEIPKFLKICSRNDLHVNDCLRNNIQTALIYLANGIPEYGLKPLDPYVKKKLKLDYVNGMFVGKAIVENIETFGLTAAKVKNVRTKFEENFMDMEIDMSNEKIFTKGHFNVEMGLDTILLKTESNFNNTITDVTWTWKIHAETKMIDGKTHLKVTKFGMRPKVGKMKFIMPEVFKEDRAMSLFAQDLARAFWRNVYREFLPEFEKYFDKIGSRVCNKIFKKIPYDELFPVD